MHAYALPLIGGLLIGAAASLLLLFNGRIAGISGILRGVFLERGRTLRERLLFLAGLTLAAGAYQAWNGSSPLPRAHFPGWLLFFAATLVGAGTGMARGCTSGHGVCGLARFSIRSLVAVLVFLGVAMITTFVVRHLAGIY